MPGKNPFCLYINVVLANKQMVLGPGILDPCPLESDDYILSWESGHRSYIASD